LQFDESSKRRRKTTSYDDHATGFAPVFGKLPSFGAMQPMHAGFPRDFRPQRVRLANAINLAELPPAEIVAYFHANPNASRDLLDESADKRWTPSTFIEPRGKNYRVGWLSSEIKFECEAVFGNLADAATDYLLFSLGKSRWVPGKFGILRDAQIDRGAKASETAIRALTESAPIPLPEVYLAFLRNSNGAAGNLGIEPGYVAFWRAEEVLAHNLGYKVAEFAPGFFGFGSNGGGELLAFDHRGSAPWPIVMIPMIPMDSKEAIQVAPDFISLLTAFGRVMPPG
jgi:hypothetical protein